MNQQVDLSNGVIFDTDLARDFLLQAGQPLDTSPYQRGLVQLISGQPVGAVLFEQNNGANVFAHCAGSPDKPWLTRQMIYNMFHYPFVQEGLKRVTLWINADNTKSIKFAEHLGFEYEATLLRAGSDGQAVMVYRMFREDCRYV